MENIEIMPARVRIAAVLKKAILAGEYRGGQELSLVEVSGMLGVSRTPVREAFQALAAEGLIELRMNKGAIVKGVDEKFIRDHYETRILLECHAVRGAVANRMDVEELREKTRELVRCIETIDQRDYVLLNQDLHAAIWKSAGNQKIYDMLLGLWNGPSVARASSPREHYLISAQEHIALLEAIRDGDADTAAAMMERHIAHGMENMMESFRSLQK